MAATSRSTESLASFAPHGGEEVALPVAAVVAAGNETVESPLSLQPTATNIGIVIAAIAISR